MPDYAEVAGCSSFKNQQELLDGSPSYDNYGAYASTTLVGRSGAIMNSQQKQQQQQQNGVGIMYNTTALHHQQQQQQPQNQFDGKNVYSAPTTGCHYNNFINQHQQRHQQQLHQQQQEGSSKRIGGGTSYGGGGSMKSQKMNIIENRMADMLLLNGGSQSSVVSGAAGLMGSSGSNLNGANSSTSNLLPLGSGSGTSASVPHTPLFGTIKRQSASAKYNKIGYNKDNKLNFGDNGRSTEQPLFIKSKYDGTWSSVPSTAASSTGNINMINNSPYHQQQPLLGTHHHQQHHQSHHHHPFGAPGPKGHGGSTGNILDPSPTTTTAMTSVSGGSSDPLQTNNLDNQQMQNSNNNIHAANPGPGSINGSSNGGSSPSYLASFGKTENV
ncbi:uncharacterized protein DDB_G0283357-like [Uranotaenia lowii]|uniref:uncharacterized protein DDB_G0283357-like n=1 Tax=Uranotaenia lowii TaxID=190385 RepID=UPI00247A8E5F|nr:uncharacterized protein DDB_G0283357-like [Uranotaenia lowii]